MGIIAPTLPTPGDPRGSEETDVRNTLSTLLTLVNGSLDDANFAAGSGMYSAYRTIFQATACLTADETGAAVYIPKTFGTWVPAGTAENIGAGSPIAVYFDDSDYTIAGRTLKLRMRSVAAVSGVAPANTITPGLYPVSGVIGAGNNIGFNLGAVVAGSGQAIATPGVGAVVPAVSGDFTPPADGLYVLGAALSAASALNSHTMLTMQLQARWV